MGALTAAAHVPSLHIPPTSTILHRVRFTKTTCPNIPISSRNMSKFKPSNTSSSSTVSIDSMDPPDPELRFEKQQSEATASKV
ncbi:hypothetical protein SLEP1_g56321 [Rubroshorea leprosula]|uniref:Uncharacterized protein n=1 Tax=Rubroshorea leprosula TaxID=152421 RepID=A0AAV5MI06_9ROSI|nr:hypothetical protein SLEP1_g56321 [Rubroshorea leprosula]